MNNILTISNQKELEKVYTGDTLLIPKDYHTIVFKENIFTNSFFTNSINYHNNEIQLTMIFENCIFKKDFRIELKKEDDFKLKKLIITSDEQKEFNEFILENIEIEKFSFKEYNCKLIKLYNIDFVENSKVLFENIITDRLHLEKISQDSKFIQFHQVTVKKHFFSERVEFKNTYFNDFKLDNAESIELIKTSFIDSHLNSVIWGDLIRIKAKKDIIRQLKFVNDSIGNHIEGNKFFAEEMRLHEIDIKKESGYTLDKFVLFFNKQISNFGQNWLLPLLWTFVITFFLLLFKSDNVILLLLTIIGFLLLDHYCQNNISKSYKLFEILVIFIFIYFINDHEVIDIVKLVSFKPFYKDGEDEYLIYWAIHKILIAFPLYHFTISLRRLTRR
ncbi:hypothetical protein [Poseidonibacter lekithochrous]|uniref:hypothetical protein n=1 Tax=Poseidonibacter lekithochrous TaxID=1904463 RepID=UPI0008FC9A64|nr:hypothetical protein [Poseidonibacter lekithochrous]QKJ23982.1 putative membrane protein [Poseidonibacter lekithochrous]